MSFLGKIISYFHNKIFNTSYKGEIFKVLSFWTITPFVFVLAVFATYSFLKNEKDKSIQIIEKNNRIVVEDKVAQVSGFIDNKFKHLEKVAKNESVKLYLSEIIKNKSKNKSSAEKIYIKKFMDKISVASGFRKSQGDNFQNKIDSPYRFNDGVSIVGTDGKKILGVNDTPAVEEFFINYLRNSSGQKRIFKDIFVSVYGVPTVYFAVPIKKVNSDGAVYDTMAYVVGTYEMDSRFFKLLKPSIDMYENHQHYIVRKLNGKVQYVTPIEGIDYKNSIEQLFTLNKIDKVENYIFRQAEQLFFAKDLFFNKVVGYSKKIKGMDWYFLRTVDEKEAMENINSRFVNTFIIFVVIFLFFFFLFVWVWKFGASVRVLEANTEKESLITRLNNANRFLKLVADSQEDEIIVLDRSGNYIFANKKAERRAKSSLQYLKGKSIDYGIGLEKARKVIELNNEVLDDLRIKTHMHKWEGFTDNKKSTEYLKTIHIPLENGLVMITFHNLTHMIEEKHQGMKTVNSVVHLLSQLLSYKTTFSPFKSEYVSTIAVDIANELHLTEQEQSNLKNSSYLLDLYKFFLPGETLDKLDKNMALLKSDKNNIKKAVDVSLKLIEQADFAKNVYKILKEKFENFDGTNGTLKGEKINQNARIVKVAEDFVDMIIHKDKVLKKNFPDALNKVMEEIGKKYDPKVVSALLNIANNKGGLNRWSHMEEERKHVIDELAPITSSLRKK